MFFLGGGTLRLAGGWYEPTPTLIETVRALPAE
jgi:hypothetical protein